MPASLLPEDGALRIGQIGLAVAGRPATLPDIYLGSS